MKYFIGVAGLLILWGISSCTSDALYAEASSQVKVVAFARHSFRGIEKKTIGPQKISLHEYGIPINTLPMLSWGEDLTPRGEAISKNFAGEALQAAANDAVKALGENETFNKKWDEFRADLATERTLLTALDIRQGLQQTIPVTGCVAEEGKAIDVVSTRYPGMKCAEAEINQTLNSSPDLELFRTRAITFLQKVRSALHIKGPMKDLPPVQFDDKGKLSSVYEDILALAWAIEMSADLGPPLDVVLPGADTQKGKDVLEAGMDLIGMHFFVKNPLDVANATGMYPLTYIDDIPSGVHRAVLTHDELISNILRALNLITENSEPHELAIFPLETIVIAISDEHASVVRMRLKSRDPDGYIEGAFANTVLWKGTRAEWNQKIQNIRTSFTEWKIGKDVHACLDNLAKNICKPEKLDIRF